MIIYILVDALKGNYITKSEMPFLHQLSSDKNNYYCNKLIPGFSFCERTEIFSGIEHKDSNFFTAIGKDDKNSPFRNFSIVLYILHCVELILAKVSIKLRNIFRKIINKIFIFLGFKLQCYNIPLKDLRKYRLTEDFIDIRNVKFQNNIFLNIKKRKLSLLYDETFTSLVPTKNYSDIERLNCSLDNLDKDIHFIYIGIADQMGHEYGPESKIFNNELQKLDSILKSYIEKINNNQKNTIILNGDHGMRSVSFNFNARKHILKLFNQRGYKEDEDFDFFIDSTIFRIWNLKNANFSFIESDPLLLEHGIFYNEIKSNEFKNLYGDLIWVINHGGLIFPNFFQQYPVKGMHGYIPKGNDDYGMAIVVNSGVHDYSLSGDIMLTDINKILNLEINNFNNEK